MKKCQESQRQFDMVFIDAFDGQDEVPASLTDPSKQQTVCFKLEFLRPFSITDGSFSG